MKPTRLAILAALVAAFFAGVGWGRFTAPSPTASPSESVATDASGDLLAEAHRRLDRLQADNDRLAARIQESLATGISAEVQAHDPTQQSESAPSLAEFAHELVQVGQSLAKKRAQGDLATLKAKVQLTAEQEVLIRDGLERHHQFLMDLQLRHMTDGKDPTRPEQHVDLASLLQTVLSPEQLHAYAEVEREEQQGHNRLIANREMLQLQMKLGLTAEQQDGAFTALYSVAEAEPLLHLSIGSNEDPTARLKQTLASKLTALRSVLTPDQLDRFQTELEFEVRNAEFMLGLPPDPHPFGPADPAAP